MEKKLEQTIEVVEIAENGAKITSYMAAKDAFRKYSLNLSGEVTPMLNKSKNFRGMVVDVRARRIYNISSKASNIIGEIGGILSWAEECERSRSAFDRIFNSNDDGLIKGAKFSAQVSGIATRVLLGMATGFLKLSMQSTKLLSYSLPKDEREKVKSRVDEANKVLDDITIQWQKFTVSDGLYNFVQIDF